MSATTQKKTKSSVIVLIIGLIISIVTSVTVNFVVGAIHKDDEFHKSLGVVSSHQPSEYSVTLNKDVSDIDGNTYPAGTPFHVFALHYQLQDNSPRFSLVYLPEGESNFNPNFVVEFNIEDINPSDDLNNDIAGAKENATKRYNDIKQLKTINTIKRILFTLLAFSIINFVTYFISKISDPIKRYFIALLFFTFCLAITFCLFVISAYIVHH